MSLVSFVKIKNNNMKQAILSSLDLINYSLPNNARSIVIKANMCYYWDYSTGQTTDPKFIGALIEAIRREISTDVDISVVESDASAMKCRHAFKFLGYEKLAQNYNVKLVNLSEDASDPVEVAINGHSFHFMVPRVIQNADLRLNVTKIKYSLEKIKITCALKNIFGCNPYPKKYIYHSKINESIVAINKAMKFDLCLIDGNIVSGSQVRKLGLVMASEDPVAIDAAAAKIAGVNPNTIRYLKIASKEGLGNTKFVAKGIPLDYFKERYPCKNARKKLMSKAFNMVNLLKLGKKLGLE
jgi:uncharacterized protein (DUF362 family)